MKPLPRSRVTLALVLLVLLVVVLGTMLLLAGLVVWRFLRYPVPGRGKQIENLAGAWTILLYLILGAIPLVWRWWSLSGSS